MRSSSFKERRGFWLGMKYCSVDKRMIPTAKKLYEANVLTRKDMQDFGFLRKDAKIKEDRLTAHMHRLGRKR